MKNFFKVLALAGVFTLGMTACNQGAEDNVINVTPASLAFSFDETTPQTLTVSATDWTLTTSDAWIHVTPQSGTGMVSISVTVDANETGIFRSGKITITNATASPRNINVTQSAPGSIPVQTIELNNTTLSLVTDDTAQLTAVVSPTDASNQSLNWESSKPSVATVSASGLVSAVGMGEAVITATAADGSGTTATCTVTVGKKEKWARSNVVWIEDSTKPDGGYLTFAVSSADNTTIPANSQGMQFLWGSLVAISPVSGSFAADRIIFSSTGSKAYDWNTIPEIGGESSDPFGNNVTSDDDFATYNGNTGFDAAAGKGDVCRYISSKGWVAGNWRMPTADELIELINAGKAIWSGVTFGQENVTADGNNPYGFYKMVSGTFFGAGVSADDDKENPATGVALPAAGYIASWGGQGASGNYGCYWAGSSYGSSSAHQLDVYSGFNGGAMTNTNRHSGMSVRCVRE